MVDIAMCFGEGCERKNDCYRYRAYPDSEWQTYFKPNPNRCGDFYPIEGRTVKSIEVILK